jgi:hypothetical protein
VNWVVAAAFGASGGGIVSAVALCADILKWQEARRLARGRRSRRIPKLNDFIDPYPDLVALVTRAALGAVAAGIFHDQVIGIQAAVAVGASAPALLSQLGSGRPIGSALHDDGAKSLPAALVHTAEFRPRLSEKS